MDFSGASVPPGAAPYGAEPATAPGRAGPPGLRRGRILARLVERGAARADDLGAELGVTTMAARQHLLALASEGLVDFAAQPQPVGRPAKRWFATEAGAAQVEAQAAATAGASATPGTEAAAQLVQQLLAALEPAVGAKGAAAVLAQREKRAAKSYAATVDKHAPLRARLEALAAARTAEGYAARLEVSDDGWYLLVQQRCPLAGLAANCPALCESEARIFKKALGKDIALERREHRPAGDPRCAFAVRRVAPGGAAKGKRKG